MRGLMAGLVLAVIVLAVVLAAASIGALGVAAIGWMLARWFDLTQWQGTLVALVVGVVFGFLVARLASQPDSPSFLSGIDDDWSAECEDEEEPCADPEPPIVPWRRSRPKPESRSGVGEKRREQ